MDQRSTPHLPAVISGPVESDNDASADDDDHHTMGQDKGKGKAPAEPTVQAAHPHDEDERRASVVSQPGLPEYEIVASTPAPVLDFEAFLAMTKPRTPVPSPGLPRKR